MDLGASLTGGAGGLAFSAGADADTEVTDEPPFATVSSGTGALDPSRRNGLDPRVWLSLVVLEASSSLGSLDRDRCKRDLAIEDLARFGLFEKC
jgi:hypothetical protein